MEAEHEHSRRPIFSAACDCVGRIEPDDTLSNIALAALQMDVSGANAAAVAERAKKREAKEAAEKLCVTHQQSHGTGSTAMARL